MMTVRASALLFASVLFAGSLHAAGYSVRTVPLPGGTPAGIAMDYIAFDSDMNSIWVPGNAGTVYVIDAATGKIRQITGFPTKEVTVRERKRLLGPSSVAFGNGKVYIGDRADNSVCAVDPKTLARGGQCAVLDSMPDGLAYVPATKEVWVTAPRDNTIRILDAATLKEKTKLAFEGTPEGFAVDARRHRFYTNLEDKDRTLAIDFKTHKTVATWNPACGEDGPHGLRIDDKSGHLFVACSAKLEVLDAGRNGAVLSSIDTGDGVDDFDYAAGMLYAGAARDAKLTIARVDAKGRLSLVASVATAAGARNPAVAKNGEVYLAHGGGVTSNDLVVVSPSAH
jgi:DNA-binding beta-propeller fold protein YncE